MIAIVWVWERMRVLPELLMEFLFWGDLLTGIITLGNIISM